MNAKQEVKARIEKVLFEGLASSKGFLFGASLLAKPLSLHRYKDWLAKQQSGQMHYLDRHLQHKELGGRPLKLGLVFGVPYLPAHPYSQRTKSDSKNSLEFSKLKIAKYALGGDYHLYLKAQLEEWAEKLKQEWPSESFWCATDSSPVLERDLAYRAGLGWIGKNSCLISKDFGSFFLIGEIFTSLDVETFLETDSLKELATSVSGHTLESVLPLESNLSPDFCGNCNLCSESCPTQAIDPKTRTLNAKECISYLTIESSEIPSIDLRKKIGSWFFGCDICQEVCPWNRPILREFHIKTNELADVNVLDSKLSMIQELCYILQSSNKALQKDFRNSALSRSAGKKLKRNALIVIGNLKIKELFTEVKALVEEDYLGDLALWTLKELETNKD